MLTFRIAILRQSLHGPLPLPPPNKTSLKDLANNPHFHFSPKNSMKSLLTAMYASGGIEGSTMPDADTVVLQSDVKTNGLLNDFSASIEITIKRNGTVRFQGHAHNGGFEGLDFNIVTLVRTLTGSCIAVKPFKGHVSGTIGTGSSNKDIDDTYTVGDPNNPTNLSIVAANFDDFKYSWIDLAEHDKGDISGIPGDIPGWVGGIVSFVMKWAIGSFISPGAAVVGCVIFLGAEIISAVTGAQWRAGALIVGDVLWLAGPYGTLFSLLPDVTAFGTGTHTREVSQDEYDFANVVFQGTLPPRDRLILTDIIGAGNRQFTFPRFDGKITLNLGPLPFNADDPRQAKVPPPLGNDPQGGALYGEIFIHELVHAWQIYHTPMDLAWMADALIQQFKHSFLGINVYTYVPPGPGPPFGNFNLEQQASIVQDWFAGNDAVTKVNYPNKAKDANSPYFSYITDNIWLGKF